MLRVQKINRDGSVKIEYTGTLRERTDEFISIDTGWSREPLDLGYVLFEQDDIWVETFYFQRCFNIFRIGDSGGFLKGFYANVTLPPEVSEGLIRWKDLAIDIWVRPDGSFLVLDEDEFEEMGPTEEERRIARRAVKEIIGMLGRGEGPFREIHGDVI